MLTSAEERQWSKNSQKPVRIEYTDALPVKGTFLGIADLVIKRWRCPWLHQEAIALTGLIGLVCLLVCF